MPIGVVLDAGVNFSGPVPLQNTDIPVETFEVVTNKNDSTTAQTANAFMAVDAVQTVFNQLHQKSQQHHLNQSNYGAPIGTFSNDQTTFTFNQPDLINIDVFPNMNTTHFLLFLFQNLSNTKILGNRLS